MGDLLVEAARCGLEHDLAFPRAERIESLPECIECLVIFPTSTIARKASLDRIEKVLIAKWLCEELDSAPLHCLHGHWYVTMGRDKDDGDLPFRGGKLALKLETA